MFEMSAMTTLANKTKIAMIFIGNKVRGIANTTTVRCLCSIIEGNDKFSDNKNILCPHRS